MKKKISKFLPAGHLHRQLHIFIVTFKIVMCIPRKFYIPPFILKGKFIFFKKGVCT